MLDSTAGQASRTVTVERLEATVPPPSGGVPVAVALSVTFPAVTVCLALLVRLYRST